MIIVTAQPQALRRGITNLIDNALKYGRRANLSIEQSPEYAAIHIDDFGVHNAPIDINRLVDPFKRGENARQVKGFGIGLSVASTVAEQHGGRLKFTQRLDGLRASLVISRTITAGSFPSQGSESKAGYMMPSEMHNSPEGLEFIPAKDSPTGPLLAVAYEMTGTVDLYDKNNLTFIRDRVEMFCPVSFFLERKRLYCRDAQFQQFTFTLPYLSPNFSIWGTCLMTCKHVNRRDR